MLKICRVNNAGIVHSKFHTDNPHVDFICADSENSRTVISSKSINVLIKNLRYDSEIHICNVSFSCLNIVEKAAWFEYVIY